MDTDILEFGPPENVYVENDWYDGPRAGIADIHGTPHRFKSLFDEKEDEYMGTFMIWPIDKTILDLEIEQWNIFVEWNLLYESGQADTETHPGHGGINKRWDELDMLLKPNREKIPNNALKARAEIESLDTNLRYSPNGPDYKLCWKII